MPVERDPPGIPDPIKTVLFFVDITKTHGTEGTMKSMLRSRANPGGELR
jgi:hypothetical protein